MVGPWGILNSQTFGKFNKEKNKYILKINPTSRKCSVSNVVKSSSSYIQRSNIKLDSKGIFVKKPRFNSTIPAKLQKYCDHDDNEMVTTHTHQGSNRNYCNNFPVNNKKLNGFCERKQSVEYDNINKCVQLGKTFSCKCLMHLEREDYTRYKNQCLFGKGESYNLRKYVSVMEKKSKLKVNPFDRSSCIYVKDDNKQCDSETWNSQEAFFVNKQIKINRHEQIKQLDSKTTVSSTISQNESSCLHETRLQNNSQTRKTKTPKTYQICSTIMSKFEENFKNKIKGNRPFSNNKIKDVTKHNPTEEVKKTLSPTLFFNDYRVIHIKDVEELLCEVSYSDTSCKTSSSQTNISSNYSSDNSCTNIIEKILDQESTNACFESLSYSINSISEGNALDTLKLKSSVHINSNYSNSNELFLKENTSSKNGFSLDSSLNKIKSVENDKKTFEVRNENPKLLTHKNQNVKTHYNGEKVDFVKICHEHKKNFRRKRTSHSMEVQRRSFIKNQMGREQKSMGENNQNLSENKDEAISIDDSKINFKIVMLENNTRELQSKITEMTEQLHLMNKKRKELETNKQTSKKTEIVSSCSQNCPQSTNKTILLVNIDAAQKQSNTVLSVHKSKKKYLNFIKPQKIYNSISTIFKKSMDNNINSKNEKVPKDNKRSIKCSNERDSLAKECQHRLIDLDFQHSSRPLVVSPKYSQFKKQEEYFSMLSKLDKLNSELRFQNKEIQFLKEYLYNTKK